MPSSSSSIWRGHQCTAMVLVLMIIMMVSSCNIITVTAATAATNQRMMSSSFTSNYPYIDCNGTVDGTAYLDDCYQCSDGDTHHLPNTDIDCDDVCMGDFTPLNRTSSTTLPQCSCHHRVDGTHKCNHTPALDVYAKLASNYVSYRTQYIYYRTSVTSPPSSSPASSSTSERWQTVNVTAMRQKPFYQRIELPFTFHFYDGFTRVIYVLESGVIAMHAITSRTSPLTATWITLCDIPSYTPLFQLPTTTPNECEYPIIAPSLMPLDCSDSQSSIQYIHQHNSTSTRIRWSSCRMATYSSIHDNDTITVTPLPHDTRVTFDAILHNNHTITFEWLHIIDPATLSSSSSSSSSSSWLAGIRRRPYLAEPAWDTVYTPMAGALSDRQYLTQWGNRTLLPKTADYSGPLMLPPSTGAYIPRDLVADGTAWSFCAINPFCIPFPIARPSGGDMIYMIFDERSWPCILRMFPQLGVAFGGGGSIIRVQHITSSVRTLGVRTPAAGQGTVQRVMLYDLGTGVLLPSSNDHYGYIEWREDWSDLQRQYGGNQRPCTRCGLYLPQQCHDCAHSYTDDPHYVVDDCGACVDPRTTPLNHSVDCIGFCWGAYMPEIGGTECVCKQFQASSILCTLFPAIQPIAFTDTTVLAPSLTRYRLIVLAVGAVCAVVCIVTGVVIPTVVHKYIMWRRFKGDHDHMMHDDQHWDPDHHTHHHDDDDGDNGDGSRSDRSQHSGHSGHDDGDNGDNGDNNADYYRDDQYDDNERRSRGHSGGYDDDYHAYHDEHDHHEQHHTNDNDDSDHRTVSQHHDDHNDDRHDDRKWEQPLLSDVHHSASSPSRTGGGHRALATIGEHDHSSSDHDSQHDHDIVHTRRVTNHDDDHGDNNDNDGIVMVTPLSMSPSITDIPFVALAAVSPIATSSTPHDLPPSSSP